MFADHDEMLAQLRAPAQSALTVETQRLVALIYSEETAGAVRWLEQFVRDINYSDDAADAPFTAMLDVLKAITNRNDIDTRIIVDRRDAAAYPAFRAELVEIAELLGPWFDRPAPGAPGWLGRDSLRAIGRSLGAARRLEALRLIGKCLTVRRLRIDDPPQGGFAILHHAAVVRLAREVVRFLRIGIEIEQLRPHADVIDELELTLADHEGAGRRP